MRSIRKQLKAAVLATLPALAPACSPNRGPADSGEPTLDAGSMPGSGGTTGPSMTNVCTQCVADGKECNPYATGCQPPCTDCTCAIFVEPVDALDGGYPDGGLALSFCRAACPDPIGPVWSCGVVDGGCNPRELGTLCIHCLADTCTGVGGRSPAGLLAPAIQRANPLADFLARAAHLEAASVHAFRRMALELRRFGAPRALVVRAQRAAGDEARHARAMGSLALRRGGRLAPVELAPFTGRDLEAFAVENAVEGTVRETLGAALALWQSLRAEDPEVRAAMDSIYPDEAEHAALSWEVDAWALARLTPRAQLRVRRARADAIARWQGAELPVAVKGPAGMPSNDRMRALLAEVQQRLWRD